MSPTEQNARDIIRKHDRLHEIGAEYGLPRQKRIDIIRKWQLRDVTDFEFQAETELRCSKFLSVYDMDYEPEYDNNVYPRDTEVFMSGMADIAQKSFKKQQETERAALANAEVSADITPDPDTAPTRKELDIAFPRDEFGNPAETHWSEIAENAERFIDAITPAAQAKGIKPSELIAEACKVLEVDALLDYRGTGKEAVQAIFRAWKTEPSESAQKTAQNTPDGSQLPSDKNGANSDRKVGQETTSNKPADKKDELRKKYNQPQRGKDYLVVQGRILIFRIDHPDWTIETEHIILTEDTAVFKAIIRNHEGRVVGTGHGRATEAGTKNLGGRYIEKAETSAIGRALAISGYGTDDTLDDSDYLSDSPIKAA